jgi:uncharacterized protein YerC
MSKELNYQEAVKKDLTDAYKMLEDLQNAGTRADAIEVAKMLQQERQYQQTLKDYLG